MMPRAGLLLISYLAACFTEHCKLGETLEFSILSIMRIGGEASYRRAICCLSSHLAPLTYGSDVES